MDHVFGTRNNKLFSSSSSLLKSHFTMLRNFFFNAIFFVKDTFLTTKQGSMQKQWERVLLQHSLGRAIGGKWEERVEGDPEQLGTPESWRKTNQHQQSHLRQFCLDRNIWFSSGSKAISPTPRFPPWKVLWLSYSLVGLSAAPRTKAPDNRAAVLEEQTAKDLGQLCQAPGHGLIKLEWSENAVSQSCVLSWRGLGSGSVWTAETRGEQVNLKEKNLLKT